MQIASVQAKPSKAASVLAIHMIANRREDACRLWKQLLRGKETELRYHCCSHFPPPSQYEMQNKKRQQLSLCAASKQNSHISCFTFIYLFSEGHMIYEWEDSPIKVHVHINDSQREGGWYIELSQSGTGSGISYLLPSLPDGSNSVFGAQFAWTGHPPRSPAVVAKL